MHAEDPSERGKISYRALNPIDLGSRTSCAPPGGSSRREKRAADVVGLNPRSVFLGAESNPRTPRFALRPPDPQPLSSRGRSATAHRARYNHTTSDLLLGTRNDQGNFPWSEQPDIRRDVVALGIDPGSRHIGWGVTPGGGQPSAHVAHGVIACDPDSRWPPLLTSTSCSARVHRAVCAGVGRVETLFFHGTAGRGQARTCQGRPPRSGASKRRRRGVAPDPHVKARSPARESRQATASAHMVPCVARPRRPARTLTRPTRSRSRSSTAPRTDRAQ